MVKDRKAHVVQSLTCLVQLSWQTHSGMQERYGHQVWGQVGYSMATDGSCVE